MQKNTAGVAGTTTKSQQCLPEEKNKPKKKNKPKNLMQSGVKLPGSVGAEGDINNSLSKRGKQIYQRQRKI